MGFSFALRAKSIYMSCFFNIKAYLVLIFSYIINTCNVAPATDLQHSFIRYSILLWTYVFSCVYYLFFIGTLDFLFCYSHVLFETEFVPQLIYEWSIVALHECYFCIKIMQHCDKLLMWQRLPIPGTCLGYICAISGVLLFLY